MAEYWDSSPDSDDDTDFEEPPISQLIIPELRTDISSENLFPQMAAIPSSKKKNHESLFVDLGTGAAVVAGDETDNDAQTTSSIGDADDINEDAEEAEGFTLVSHPNHKTSASRVIEEIVDDVTERSVYDDEMTETLLNSHLSELTQRPFRGSLQNSSIIGDSHDHNNDEEDLGQWCKEKLTYTVKKAIDYLNTPNGRTVASGIVCVAFALLTSYSLNRFVDHYGTKHLEAPSSLKTTQSAYNPPVTPKIQEGSRAPAGNDRHQPGAYYETRQFIEQLTSSQNSEQLKSVITSSSTAFIPVSVAMPKASSVSKKSLKDHALPRPKFPSKGKAIKEVERFYVFRNTGRIIPFDLGRSEKGSDRLGPYTKISGDKEKFKADFSPFTGRFSVAHVGSHKIKGATAIVVSREGKVLQRGHLKSADSTISWVPSKVPKDDLYGRVQLLFALPAESAFQVNVLDLGKQPFQWSEPPKKAAAFASDVMHRVKGALIVWVEPIRFTSPPSHKPSSQKPSDEPSAPISSSTSSKSVLARAHTRALALAATFRHNSLHLPSSKTGQRLATMNDKAVKALDRYRGEVIGAVNGQPRKALARAHRRIRKLRNKVEKLTAVARTCQKKRKVAKRASLRQTFGWNENHLA